MNYQYAASELTGRCKQKRKIGNNTWLIRRSDTLISLRLHNTDILDFFADGKVQYDTGGWDTVTTKSRMHEHGPARIGSNRGTLEIHYGGVTIPYFNGICCWNGKLWADESYRKILHGVQEELAEQIEKIITAAHWATRKSAMHKATEKRAEVLKYASIIENVDVTKYTIPEIPLEDANAFQKWEQRTRNLRQLFVVSERLNGVKEPRTTNWLFSEPVQQWNKLEVA